MSAQPGQDGANTTTEPAREIALADHVLEVTTDAVNPAEWAELAQQAGTLREEAIRDLRVRRAHKETMAPNHQAEHHLHIDHSIRPRGPEIGL